MRVSVIPRKPNRDKSEQTDKNHNKCCSQFRNSEFDLRRGDGSEPFLPGSVPDLEFNSFSIYLYSSNLKVNSNSGYITAYKVHKSMNVYSVMTS